MGAIGGGGVLMGEVPLQCKDTIDNALWRATLIRSRTSGQAGELVQGYLAHKKHPPL